MNRSFDQKHFSMGSVTAELEKALATNLNVPYVVVTTSGTAALTMAMLSIGIGPGDEVIVPDLTWIATAQAASTLGATVVPVDSRADRPVIDESLIEEKITSRTKVIVPVHTNGRACNMDRLTEIARTGGFPIIEDACKAMFSRIGDDYMGTIGDLGCYSMGLCSVVSAGYGGFVVTRSRDRYEKLRLIRDHGVDRVDHDSYIYSGSNFKISDILSSLALGQTRRLKEKTTHIKEVFTRYRNGLAGHPYADLVVSRIEDGELPLFAEVRTQYPDELVSYLADHSVGTSRHHPPIHTAPYLTPDATDEDFPHASSFTRENVVLPCGPSQPLENVDRVIQLMTDWKPSSVRSN
jgi:dTDP-4-amino-4,6-dideoxygalactose transaminase